MTEEQRDLVVRQAEDLLGHELVVRSRAPQAEWLSPIPNRMMTAMGEPIRRWEPELPGVAALVARNFDVEASVCRRLDGRLVCRIRRRILHGRRADRPVTQQMGEENEFILVPSVSKLCRRRNAPWHGKEVAVAELIEAHPSV